MIAKHKGEVPFIVYLLPFITGILYSITFHAGSSLLPLVLFGLLLALFVGFNLFYKKLEVYKFSWIGGLFLHLLLFFAGILIVQQHDDRIYANYFVNKKAGHLIGVIDNEPILKGKYWHFSASIIQADQAPTKGKLLLTVMADSSTAFNYGDKLLIPANYKPIDPPFNPAVFNYKAYLANQHIHQQSFLYTGQYKVISRNLSNPVIAYSLQLRQRLVKLFNRNIKDADAAAVASTLILGYKAELSTDILQAYSKTGTIHVLSVSGAHVAIVFVFISFALSFLSKWRRGQWIKAILSILLIWAYAMLTGFSPAVCRSAIMISMVILGRAGYRNNNTANLLALSAFVLLIYDPLLIADVGFQLSYLAVLGLIILQPVINKWFNFKNKYASKLWYYISASIAAQLITFPLSAFYFHQFPLYFLVSNLFIIIPSELILFSGILAMLFSWVPMIGKAIFWILEYTIILMNKVLTWIEHQPFSSIDKIWFNTLECTLLFIFIIALFYFLHSRKSWLLTFSLICLLIVSTSLTVRKINCIATNSITFFSINKHYSILFKNGNNGVLISDMKPIDTNFKYDVQPAIDSNQIWKTKIISIDNDIKTAVFTKHSSTIQFFNKRIIIFDRSLMNVEPSKKIYCDYIYLTGNPYITMVNLREYYNYKTLIIDATNSTYIIKRLTNESDSLGIKYIVLKRNKSYTIVSN